MAIDSSMTLLTNVQIKRSMLRKNWRLTYTFLAVHVVDVIASGLTFVFAGRGDAEMMVASAIRAKE